MKKPATNNQISVDIAVMANKVDNIQCTVREIKDTLERDYVTQDQFLPIQKVVYGLVSIILLAVVGALVTLVINR
jgi:hypothetical protein